MNVAIALRADAVSNKTIDTVIGVLPSFTIELAKIFLAAVVYSKISHRSKAIFF